jgi:hypothetical protein
MLEDREWWPPILIQLHKHWWVNYPPVLDSILAGLIAHTSSYMMLDKEAAVAIRTAAEKNMIDSIQNMGRLHEEAMAANKEKRG